MRRLPIFHRLAIVLALMGAFSCSNPAGPAPPPPAPDVPAIQCPASVQADLIDAASVVVDYPAPQVSGGSAPVTAACTVASGATFTAGTTDIICTATDALARTAQCVFQVAVTVVPRLKGTKIVAFGDSITWGEVSPPFTSSIQFYDPVNNYPSVLGQLLSARYKAQGIVVINEGIPGEKVLFPGDSGFTGEGRIERLVDSHHPDVMIILEGVNGLNTTTDAELIGQALRRGVRRAKGGGVPLVIVSTILPGVQSRPKAPNPDAVDALNDEIRFWAHLEGAVLVDSYAQFEGMQSSLIGQDGLHPTVAGYQKLGEIFFEAIRANFELPPLTVPPAAAPAVWRGTTRRR